MISYEDFDLRLRADGEGFVVSVLWGSQSATEPLELDLSGSWDLWQLAPRRPRKAREPGPAPCDDALIPGTARDLVWQGRGGAGGDARELGSALFDALIRGRVRDLYQQARGSAGGDAGKGLRVRILLDARDGRLRPLLRLPWEILFDRAADSGNLPALDPRRPIVRVIDSIEQTLVPVPGPLRHVLLVLANPRTSVLLDIESECAAVEQALERIPIRPAVLRQATRSRLLESICDGEHQVVHFMGHGALDPAIGEGVIALEDEHREQDLLPASTLASFFAGRPMPRLVVLASCHSAEPGLDPSFGPFASVAAALVAAGLPAVVAMQTAVRDRSAIRFTERLYRRMVLGDPIEAAVSHARNALRAGQPEMLDWAVPVLFVRGQVEGPLLGKAAAVPASPPSTARRDPSVSMTITSTSRDVQQQTIIGYVNQGRKPTEP
jgi:CHAT domain